MGIFDMFKSTTAEEPNKNDDNALPLKDRTESDILKEFGNVVRSSCEGIQIEVHPQLNHIPTNGIKVQNFPVLFNIGTGPIPQKDTREPLNICIVLDRSGSMAGKWLAECKRGIQILLSKLCPDDFVHLVVYDDTADVMFEGKHLSDIDSLKGIVDSIEARGCTNISLGLQTGVDLLNKYSEVVYKKVLFLFSDGEANGGIKDVETLGQMVNDWNKTNGITFTSFGIGQHFNEKLLKGVARCGKGIYNYLDDPELTTKSIVKSLFCATSTIGKNAVLRVHGMGNNYVKEIAFTDDIHTLLQGKTIGNLSECNIVQVLVMLEYDPKPPSTIETEEGDLVIQTQDGTGSSEITKSPVLSYKLTFDKTDGLDYVSDSPIEAILEMSYTNDLTKLVVNPEVEAFLASRQGAELELKVSEMIAQSNMAGAKSIKREIVKLYESHLGKSKYLTVDMMYAQAVQTLAELDRSGLSSHVVKKQHHQSNMAYAVAGITAYQGAAAAGDTFECDEAEFDMGGGMDMFGGGETGGGDY